MMMAKSKGVINYVKFLGHISNRRELVSLYQGAYGYLHPAHYEGLPTVRSRQWRVGFQLLQQRSLERWM